VEGVKEIAWLRPDGRWLVVLVETAP